MRVLKSVGRVLKAIKKNVKQQFEKYPILEKLAIAALTSRLTKFLEGWLDSD